ncbi:hypothetical protein EVAR_50959_1 [Eumeta japonica]|uniref:Uncharacterized protein n=1 Tax=Eumeta variegata TaxID=151549 RepID=A0A4C1XEH6_EUMVA|nr:hypothetical protein EVAR_50959_1 [Eumeta japonica]
MCDERATRTLACWMKCNGRSCYFTFIFRDSVVSHRSMRPILMTPPINTLNSRQVTSTSMQSVGKEYENDLIKGGPSGLLLTGRNATSTQITSK